MILCLKRVPSTFVIHSMKDLSSNKFYLFQPKLHSKRGCSIAGNVHNAMKTLKVFRVIKHGSWRWILIHLTPHLFTNEGNWDSERWDLCKDTELIYAGLEPRSLDKVYIFLEYYSLVIVSSGHFKTGHLKNAFQYIWNTCTTNEVMFPVPMKQLFWKNNIHFESLGCRQYSPHSCEGRWSFCTRLLWLTPLYN